MIATETKERPILFSGPMVRAILDGRKTQTRRVVKPQPKAPHLGYMATDGGALQCGADYPDGDDDFVRCPYGVPGDRLWVRETWMPFDRDHWVGETRCAYRANSSIEGEAIRQEYVSAGRDYRWRPSIHMPRWASRITLEVTDVRVERLQEIQYPELRREGFEPEGSEHMDPGLACLTKFRSTWNQLNADRGFGWDSNPWVWVVNFKQAT